MLMLLKVDWYPWGEEAFAEARKRDVPIFLSSNSLLANLCKRRLAHLFIL